MCGIFLSSCKVDNKSLKEILNRLNSRGPDDLKIRSSNEGTYLFTRLAITGRNVSAMQPLNKVISEKNDFFLFNGEIYNYKDLNKKLGIKSKNNLSDTIVLQRLIEKYKLLKSLKKINGMYAICYVTKNFKEVCLARDTFGQKPLYYRIFRNNWYVSSDPYCIALATSVDLDNNSFKNFIFSNEDFGTKGLLASNSSFFKEINAVPPNSFIKINKRKILQLKSINRFSKIHLKNKFDDLKKTAAKLKLIIENVVKNYCGQHKDVAFTYSGGIDSTILLLASLRLKKKFTYYTKIADKIDDVAKNSIRKLKFLGIKKFYRIKIKESDYLSYLIDFIKYSGSAPRWGTAPSVGPLYRLMNSHKNKICIGGDGADELFFGYGNNNKIVKDFDTKKNFIKIKFLDFVQNYTNSGWMNYNPRKLKSYFSELKKYKKIFSKMKKNKINFLLFSRLVDLNFFLSRVVNPHSDLCSMKYSIELRSPFLDDKVVEFAINECNSKTIFDTDGFQSKLLLKEILKSQCKDLNLNPKLFIENEKHGTRNFALQFAKKIKISSLPIQIRKIFSKELKGLYSLKTKYKIISLSIFYLIFVQNKNKGEILQILKK